MPRPPCTPEANVGRVGSAASGAGAVTPEEVPILASPGRRLQARLAAGPRGYFRLGRLQRAQIALAMQRWHREREELELPQESEQELRGQILALRSAGG